MEKKMNKIIKWLGYGLIGAGGIVTGLLARQPKINKLTKQVKTLQQQLSTLQEKMHAYQDSFDNLLIKYKGLKILQLKKKAEYHDKLKDNLMLQYGIKDYIIILFESSKNQRKLTNLEKVFYKSFDDVIEGKELGESTFANIKKYVLNNHENEITALKPCDYTYELQLIQDYKGA